MHILHNAAKYALQLLSFDLEILLIIVFDELPSSARKRSELKDLFIFLETEYFVLRHVPTRFLSLFAAVNRSPENWTTIKSVFFCQGEENVSTAKWIVFLVYETYCEVADELTLPEQYLYFVHNVICLFNVRIK
jgi:multisubunit Na+/H+ antiporter MnhB subunit